MARAAGVARTSARAVVASAVRRAAQFFLAFPPQFVRPAQAVALQLVLLGTVCVALNTLADVVAVLWSARLLASRAVRMGRHDAGARRLSRAVPARGLTGAGAGACCLYAVRVRGCAAAYSRDLDGDLR